MFTGLVETVGTLCGRGAERLRIRPAKKLEALRYGESVAVNGCCLTLERELPDGTLEFYTLSETLKRTNLGLLPVGAKLNMERALRLGDRLGGHIVSGHVDATAEVISYSKRADGDYELKLTLPASLAREVVEKGSVAIDGVSLTVVEVGETHFTVHLIPVTRSDTALAAREPGSTVNLEGDVIGKYVIRQLEFRSGAPERRESSISMDTLREAGFLLRSGSASASIAKGRCWRCPTICRRSSGNWNSPARCLTAARRAAGSTGSLPTGWRCRYTIWCRRSWRGWCRPRNWRCNWSSRSSSGRAAAGRRS